MYIYSPGRDAARPHPQRNNLPTLGRQFLFRVLSMVLMQGGYMSLPPHPPPLAFNPESCSNMENQSVTTMGEEAKPYKQKPLIAYTDRSVEPLTSGHASVQASEKCVCCGFGPPIPFPEPTWFHCLRCARPKPYKTLYPLPYHI